MSQLGMPISGALNLNPLGAGNPYQGIMAGPAGLAQQYSQSYNNALAANQKSYDNILTGYQTVMDNVGRTLGQGGGWGIAAPAAQAIDDAYAQAAGGAFQNSINKGIGNTTAASAAQRGAALDKQKALAGLGSQLAQTYAQYQSNLGQGQLNFMNSVNIPYPNGAEYSALYQQYGQAQANAQNNAMLQQAQRQANFAANQAVAGRGGGGGVNIPQMPRGGTYGSGGGGFPSGGPGSSLLMYPNGASGDNTFGAGGGRNPWSSGGGGFAGGGSYVAAPSGGSGFSGGAGVYTGGGIGDTQMLQGAGLSGGSFGGMGGSASGSENLASSYGAGPSVVQAANNAKQEAAAPKSPYDGWGLSDDFWD